jgi:hypothetical protein
MAVTPSRMTMVLPMMTRTIKDIGGILLAG